MDRFLTTYRKDYKDTHPKKIIKYRMKQEFRDPLNESFREYLKLRGKVASLEPREDYSDTYLEKFKELYPKLGKKYFEAPINNPIVERSFLMNGQSVYQLDYCDTEKDKAYIEELRTKHKVTLPPDVVLPQTTTTIFHRDPRMLNPRALERVKPIRQTGNMDLSNDVKDILQIKTGYSEYQGIIGDLGNIIVTDQIHGKIVHPECTCTKHHPKD